MSGWGAETSIGLLSWASLPETAKVFKELVKCVCQKFASAKKCWCLIHFHALLLPGKLLSIDATQMITVVNYFHFEGFQIRQRTFKLKATMS